MLFRQARHKKRGGGQRPWGLRAHLGVARSDVHKVQLIGRDQTAINAASGGEQLGASAHGDDKRRGIDESTQKADGRFVFAEHVASVSTWDEKNIKGLVMFVEVLEMAVRESHRALHRGHLESRSDAERLHLDGSLRL